MHAVRALQRAAPRLDDRNDLPASGARLRVAEAMVISLVPCHEGGELGDGATRVERASLFGSNDVYDPESDPVAPISIRTSFMELLWVCGDCGEHYRRAQSCPDKCLCGAPRQHFYAPTED